jgi:hypothetical protein
LKDEDNFSLDIEKLSKYINFQISFRMRENGKSTYKKAGFRKCSVKDFEDVNFKIN